MKVVFYTSTPERKDEYATETFIYKASKGLLAYKRPLKTSAENHITNMLNNYKKLKDVKFPDFIEIIKPQTYEDGISFDFINGVSAERTLVSKILEKDTKSAIDIITKLQKVINSLPNEYIDLDTVPGFRKFFGNVYSGKHSCIENGVIDLNLDNFIIGDNGNWCLFDYEWFLNFPVPKDYVFGRFIFWFFIVRYQEIFRFLDSKYPLVLLGDNIFVPEFIYNEYENIFKNMNKIMKTEESFQKHVNKHFDGYGLVFYDKAKRLEAATHQKILAERNPLLKIERLGLEKKRLNEELVRANKEIAEYKNSKGYKYLNKARRIKEKFSRK